MDYENLFNPQSSINDDDIHHKYNDDALEFRQFCQSSQILRDHPGNATVIEQICLEGSDFDHNDLIQLLSIVIILGIGAFIRDFLQRLNLKIIPYTVAVFFVGLGVGRIAARMCPLLENFVTIVHLKPKLILTTFLPILIFESGCAINIHVFRRTLPQILLLAGPGLLISTFLTAAISMFLFIEYEWDFIEASLFGSIISATDPVAVVGVLRELGAAESLSVLIEGESLLNDGMAVLLFKIFEDILVVDGVVEQDGNGNLITLLLSIFIKFCLIAVGGPLFGYVFGKVTIFCLSKVYNDSCVEVSLTLASAYLTFFIGEEVLGVSGILAVVFLALTIKANSTSCISPQSEEPLRHFLEVMGYMANTLLFFLIGLIIGRKAFQGLQVMDFPYLFALYAAVMLIRFFMLILLKPILHKFGYGFDLKTLLVVSWGGLRGAVGLCLALEVYEDPHLCNIDRLGPKILFQTAGVVLLTLLINATTTKRLMEALNMNVVSDSGICSDALEILEKIRTKYFNGLKFHRDYINADWDFVKQCTFIPTGTSSGETTTTVEESGLKAKMKLILLAKINSSNIQNEGINKPVDELEELEFDDEDNRIRVLKAFKISFRRQYEQGVIQGHVLQFLLEECDRMEDVPSQMLTSHDIMSRWSLEKIINFPSIPCCGRRFLQFSRIFTYFIKESEKERVHLNLEVGKAFVTAVDQVLAIVPKILLYHDDMDKDEEYLRSMKKYLEQEKHKVIVKLNSLQICYPKMIIAAKTKYAARTVINQMKTALAVVQTEGLIERGDALVLTKCLEKLIKQLHKCTKTKQFQTSPEAIMSNLSWLQKIVQPQTSQFLKSKAVLLHFLPGDVIYKIGDVSNGIYLIITGLAKVQFIALERIKLARQRYGMLPVCEALTNLDFNDSFSDLIGPGGVIGEIGYLKQECRSASVTCETFLTAYFFPSELLDVVVQAGQMSYPKTSTTASETESDDLLLHLWTSWGFKIASELCKNLPKFQDWTMERIQGYLERGIVPSIKPFSVFEITHIVSDVIVIEGYFEDIDSNELFIAPSLIPRHCTRLFSKRNPLTVNKLFIITDEDTTPEDRTLYYASRRFSYVFGALGVIRSEPILMKRSNIKLSEKRMDPRLRRLSLAITNTTSSKDKAAPIKKV